MNKYIANLLVQRMVPTFRIVRGARMRYFTHVSYGQRHLFLEFQLVHRFVVRQIQKRLAVHF